jgi:hypothetical protein
MDEYEVEGAISRDLFRTDSDSEEDEEGYREQQEGDMSVGEDNLGTTHETFVLREILHCVVEEQQIGGGIATRLWPAAEYLAEYIVQLSQMKSSSKEFPESLDDIRKGLAGSCDDENSSQDNCIPILELGSGIGLTGLELATQLNAKLLMTEIDEGLPLLKKNTELNRGRFRLGKDAVSVGRLSWSSSDDCECAIEWYKDLISSSSSPRPLLILASDCVYWESLHEPLERALQQLLSACPGSVCILAGMRRWKRDNHFYLNLGRQSRTPTHELRCTRLKETVRREKGERVIMRVFEVRWCERESKKKRGTAAQEE